MNRSSRRDPFLFPGPRAALLGRLGQLTVLDLHALDAAVRALGGLFGDVVVAIAHGVTGLDVERFGVRPPSGQQTGVFGDLVRLLRPASAARSLQDAAIGLIEGAAAPWDPRLAIVACWNVACAATLRAHLRMDVVDMLEGAWRRALGEPPA